MRTESAGATGLVWTCALVIAAVLVPYRVTTAQEQKAPPSGDVEVAAYANSVEGLRRLLQEMLKAVRDGQTASFQAQIKELEIPDYANWFVKVLGPEKGGSLAATYASQIEEHEAELTDLIKRMARSEVEVAAERVDAKTLYDSVTGHLDVYLADWAITGPDGRHRAEHIGYFYFIDGKFRWDSNYSFAHRLDSLSAEGPAQGAPKAPLDARKINVAAAPGSFPRCVYCPNPEYTKDALKAKFNGVVVLSVVVQADGTARDLKVTKSTGFASLDEKSIETVRQWRFRPAVDRDGNPVPSVTAIECTFRLHDKH